MFLRSTESGEPGYRVAPRALEVMLSAEDYDAERAERYGRVNQVEILVSLDTFATLASGFAFTARTSRTPIRTPPQSAG
jgi:hypothetical protein